MDKRISMNNSEVGRKIWDGVSRAAKSSPEWAQTNVRKAAQESASRIAEERPSKDRK